MAKQANWVRLSRREWAVLRVLIGCGGGAISPRQLLNQSLNRDDLNSVRNLYKYIGRLRKKLESDPQQPRRLLLERGRGYRLKGPDSSWPVIIHPGGRFFGSVPAEAGPDSPIA